MRVDALCRLCHAPEKVEQMLASIPTKRSVEIDELVGFINYLSSEQSLPINGVELPFDHLARLTGIAK